MEVKHLMLRLSLVLVIFFSFNAHAIAVLVSTEAIKYEAKIDNKNVKIKNISKIKKNCKPLSLNQLKKNIYLSTHYINKNRVICQKDVRKFENTSVIFNFGGVQIEKKGKIIYENDELIRIKNLDGTIEKIYKDGRLK